MQKTKHAKQIPCTVCGINSSLEKNFSNISLYRCPDCDHCFTKFTDALEEYSDKYYDEVHQNWFNNPNLTLFETIHGHITSYKRDSSVIDVGCGRGDLLRYLHKKNPSLSLAGIELIPNSPVNGVTFLQEDILSMDINRQYDVVVNTAVIEHITDVRMFIKRIHALCAPGGLVIINTINERSILYMTARLLYIIGYKVPLERLYERHHLNHFNVTSLKRLVENSGLLVKKMFHHNIPLAAIDLPASSPMTKFILHVGVWGTFALGRLTNRTFMQTIVCQKE